MPFQTYNIPNHTIGDTFNGTVGDLVSVHWVADAEIVA